MRTNETDNNVFSLIVEWANERDIIQGATTHAQLVKLLEEAGELAHGIGRHNEDLVKDSIGDCAVVLTILAAQFGFTFEECVQTAYDQIKNRTGKKVDGIFVKDEEQQAND